MRIRQFLYVCVVLALGLVLMRLVVLEVHSRQGERLDQFQLGVERIARDSASLMQLSQDFLLHGDAGTTRRWVAVHADLSRALPSVPADSAELQDEVDGLREKTQSLSSLFSAVASAAAEPDRAKAKSRLEMLSGHLVEATRRTSDEAFELSEKLGDVRRQRDVVHRRVTWATMLAFATLVLTFAVVTARKVLRPLLVLERVAASLGSGQLDARSNYGARDELGKLSRAFDTMAQVLSERTSSQEAVVRELQEVHTRLTIATDSADIGIWEFDPQANTLVWDDRMYRLYGRERSNDKEPYALWEANVHPEDRSRSVEALGAALRGECDFEPEFRIVWPSGEVRHLQAKARVTRDAAGRPLHVTGVNIDITDRKRADAELFETAALLGAVLQAASDVAIIGTDPQLNIKVFNAGAQNLLGYRDDEIVGRNNTPSLFHDPEEVQARARELSLQLGHPVEGGAVFTEPSTLGQAREWTYVRQDGSRVRVVLVVTAMVGADGALLGYLGLARDVTLQNQYEESLLKATLIARNASEAKSQFLANMSHEIRTPMNAVIGLSYVLRQTALDEAQAGMLAKIEFASKSLLALINDILDLSKVEAGEMAIEQLPFSLRQLLLDLSGVMGVHAQAKGLAFELDAPPNLPVALAGDAMRLTQVLTNLVANAIKFTAVGGVTLRVRQVSAMDEEVRLRFTVVDSGIGIAPEVQARLFTPFAQADATMTRRFGGTGLGLSIVKQLTDLMGGEVSLASTLGVGSEFAVELPFALVAPEALTPPLSTTLRPGQRGLAGVRVLVTDDSEVNLEVARCILGLEGALVTLARNGRQACELLQSRPQDFDVVLMDVQMPELDGYDTTRYIRHDLAMTELPVIALTAGAMSSERQRASAAGMNDFVTKPFDPQALLFTILRHLPAHIGPGAGPLDPGSDDRTSTGAAHWPEIDGIDSADVSGRLGGDLGLFQTLLARLLDEFADVALPGMAGDAGILASQAGRMHKLNGGAGLLGAKVIAQLAGEAEAACRTGDAGRAGLVCEQLAIRLHALAQSAAPVRSALPNDDEEEKGAGDGPIDPQVVVRLMELLRRKDLASIDYFASVSPQLRLLLGKESYLDVRRHIDNLEFKGAAKLLEAWSTSAASAVAIVF